MKNIFATGVWDVLHKEKKTIHQSRDADGFTPSVADWQEKWKGANEECKVSIKTKKHK